MSARALTFDLNAQDLEESRGRTGWTMSASLLVHGALLLWLLFLKPAGGAVETLTEITLLDSAQVQAMAAAGAPAPASPGPRETGLRRSDDVDDHFRRQSKTADFAPDPQSDLASADRVSARLASLRQDVHVPVTGGEGAPMALWSTPAGVPNSTGGGGTAARGLDRGKELGGGQAVALGRGGGSSGAGPARAADVAVSGLATTPAPASESDSHARRSVAGAQIAGPIADRPVLQVVTPLYPDWAKRDGVEATVTLYFIVRSDGSVKENVLVQKTAGFAEFDDNARAALAAWRFEPLHGGRTGDQWGTITFHYKLRDQ
jgi:TonB family protein